MRFSSSSKKEDIAAIGLLVTFSLWLFVGLPLLPRLSQFAHQEKMDSFMTGVSILAGFCGGSLATWFIARFFAYLDRPIINAQLVQEKGCYVTTWRGNPTPTHKARFLRLLVENRGSSTIHNCKGYVTSIRIYGSGSSPPPQQEVLELEWAHSGAAPRSIPRGAFFYLDVVSLDLRPTGSDLGFCAKLPNHLFNPPVRSPATFELEIRIVADNADPFDRIVRFDYDVQKQDLTFSYD